jgi:hypothetical protein
MLSPLPHATQPEPSARRSEPKAAARLLAVFEQRGRDALVHEQRVGSHQ